MRFLSVLILTSLLATNSLAQAPDDLPDSVFEARFQSFIDGGYDPLTTPPDWYTPTETVRGTLWQDPARTAPEERTIPGTALAAADDYAQGQDSIALLIARGGMIEYEAYWNGAGRDTVFNPQSMSKTVLALLIGAAIHDEHIASVDDPVSAYLPALKDDPKGAITLRHLLQMSAGMAQISDSYAVTRDNPGVAQHFGTDFIAPIMSLGVKDTPGTVWEYNNNESNLLGHILTQATGMRYAEYLSKTLWQPLGLRDARMYQDRPDGAVMMSCCILSRPMDWLKIGMLIRDKGRYRNRQIIPAAWIEEMITPAATWDGYGYQIWLGDQNVSPERPDGPSNLSWASAPYAAKDMIVLRGHGFQRVWIVPSQDLVILRAGRTWPPLWDESALPNTILNALD